jgi:hypothetical protein
MPTPDAHATLGFARRGDRRLFARQIDKGAATPGSPGLGIAYPF